MRHAKISVTLAPEVAAELDRVAGRRGRSAFVNAAVRQYLQAARVRKMLDWMAEVSGPIPNDVQRRVDELEWPG